MIVPQGSRAMTVQEKPYPVVSLMVDAFGEWLKHRREMREMSEMDVANFNQIAGELRMSPTDLEELVRQGPHAADELPKMLVALGIDQEALARTEPHVLRDMERVCSMCNHKRQCDRDLAAGTAATHYEEYCGNADTIDGLGPRVHQ
jgi:transcriptional regulator with XRE-family HTH domain